MVLALALVITSGCGSDVEAGSPGEVLASEQSVPTEQTSSSDPTEQTATSVPMDSATETPLPQGSLKPGPNVDDLVSASTTDLVIVKPNSSDNVLRAAISEFGGEIHFDSDELGLYGARFETESAAELAEIRDELRRRGFDATIDIESADPTT
ncbi:MAG: hypothetical protein GY788_32885 [bacterium]|nr:hypothetical protein [bacterium]